MEMDRVEMSRDGAHRPPAKPLRGGAHSGPRRPPAVKVYCVEPRDFRELVQRLTGARTAAPAPAMGAEKRATLTPAAVSQNEAAGQFDYSPWFSAPLFSPAYAPPCFDGHRGNQGR